MLVRWISSVRLFPLSFSLWCVHNTYVSLRFLFTPDQQIDFAFYFLLHLISSQEKDAFSLPINLTIILTTWKGKKAGIDGCWNEKLTYTSSIRRNCLHSPISTRKIFPFLWFIWHMNPVSEWTKKEPSFESSVFVHLGIRYRDNSTRTWHPDMKRVIFLPSAFSLRHGTNATKTKQKKTKSCFHSPNTLPSSSFMGFNDIESPAHKSNHHLTFSNPFHFPSIKNNMRMNEKISFTKHFNGHSAKASTKNTTSIQCEVFCKIKFNGHNVAKSSNPIRLNDKHFAHPQKQHTHC